MEKLVIPNLKKIKQEYDKLEQAYDLNSRMNRYKSSAPELIAELQQEEGLKKEEDVICVLFIADFVVTSSEVPLETTGDKKRYLSLAEAFKKGMESRNQSSDILMRIIALAYKTAVIIRRQDLFLAGRGLNRTTALIMIKDAYILPYLQFAREKLGEGSCGWELSMLHAALTRSFPHNILENYKDVPEAIEYGKMVPSLWELLKAYKQTQDVKRNENVVVPNIQDSASILAIDPYESDLISSWQVQENPTKSSLASLKNLENFLSQNDKRMQKKFVSFKGRLKDSQESFIVTRNPFVSSNRKPLFLIKSKVSDINVTKAGYHLNLRSMERSGWLELAKKIKRSKRKPREKKIKEKEREPSEKKSLFGKIIGFITSVFGGKKKQQTSSRQLKTRAVPEKPKIPQESQIKIPKDNLAYALTVSLVGDFQLEELFDNIRESDYLIQAITEHEEATNYQEEQFKTLKYEDTQVTDLEYIGKLVNLLQEVQKQFFSTEEPDVIIPEELFWITADIPKDIEEEVKKYIVSTAGNKDRVVYVFAETLEHDITEWREKDKKEMTVSRRTLNMRTDQLLKSRDNIRHLEDAIDRIFKEEIKKDGMIWE